MKELSDKESNGAGKGCLPSVDIPYPSDLTLAYILITKDEFLLGSFSHLPALALEPSDALLVPLGPHLLIFNWKAISFNEKW